MNNVLQAQGISKTYQDADQPITILQKLSCTIEAGETVAIMGRSGSGKTTLLNVLGGLDVPSSGEVWVQGVNIHQFSGEAQARFRNQKMGFIYQFHHLLPEFSALENVAMPLLIAKHSPKEAKAQARVWLEQVGLGERLNHMPSMLSGGERQRVAVARALVTEPSLLLADEPTGNLDFEHAAQVLDLLLAMAKKQQTAVIVVTHDNTLAARLDKKWVLKAGQLALASS